MFKRFKSRFVRKEAIKVYRASNECGIKLAIGYTLYKHLVDPKATCQYYFEQCVNSTDRVKKAASESPRRTYLLYKAFKKHSKAIDRVNILHERTLNEVPV